MNDTQACAKGLRGLEFDDWRVTADMNKLDLSGRVATLGKPDITLLAASLYDHQCLTTVNLSDVDLKFDPRHPKAPENVLWPEALETLAKYGLANNFSVRSLDLSLNRLAEGADERTVFKKADHRGIDALADVLRAPDGSNIEYINLSWCQLDSTALKQLVNKGLLDAKSNGKLSLVRLDLSNNCLDGRAAEALANFFKAPYKGGGLAFMPPTQKKRMKVPCRKL